MGVRGKGCMQVQTRTFPERFRGFLVFRGLFVWNFVQMAARSHDARPLKG